MISYDMIVAAIQQHASEATGDEAQVREQLTAIRALCDVALANERQAAPQRATAAPMQMAQPVPAVAPQIVAAPSLPTKKINEDDANGDSLFDF